MNKKISLLLLSATLLITNAKAQCTFTANITPSGSTTICGPDSVNLLANTIGNTWTQKANFGGTERWGATSFSIGSKGYIATGFDGATQNDLWEYDPTTDVWTQKANFAGTPRKWATAFCIGGKGYLGTGDDGTYTNDFWEYDPIGNTWTKKADFAGTGRHGAVGFSIGNKGYLGTGYDGSLTNDFWEYDPNLDSWTQKANFGGAPRRLASAFSIGNKGYIGTGLDGSFFNDFWEYNAQLDSWTQKVNFGGVPRYYAVGFTILNKGYIGTGTGSTGNYNDFWEYDTLANSWAQKTNFLGSARLAATAFSIGSKGYIGAGATSFASQNDFYEYEPSAEYMWSTGANTQSIEVKTSGTYTLVITNASGCKDSSSQVVTFFPLPTITSVTSNTLLCIGQTATLTASGAATYTWSTSAVGDSVSVNPITNTAYTVTGTDVNGCTNSSVLIQNVTTCSTGISVNNFNSIFLSAYPNPASNYIVIPASAPNTKYVHLYSANGTSVKEYKFEGNDIRVDLSSYENGLYLFIITDENNLPLHFSKFQIIK